MIRKTRKIKRVKGAKTQMTPTQTRSHPKVISLKLQMGIDPSTDIEPELLRAMWNELTTERTRGYREDQSHWSYLPAKARHPRFRTGR